MLDSRRDVVLACALTALAGYVDGIGFLHLGGLFVSFMSGNSTRLGVGLAGGDWSKVPETLGLIALFVVGAAAGSLIVRGHLTFGPCRVLMAEALLLAVAAMGHAFDLPGFAPAGMVLAMGLENAVFRADGSSALGLTYVTGALVRVGQFAALALAGGPRWGWLPSLLLWAALVAGAVVGAFVYRSIGLTAIWFAAGAALAFGAMTFVMAKQPH